MNLLYYGDCLTVMRSMPPASVDLIYLDPPFNSSRAYGAVHPDAAGRRLPDRVQAFSDLWALTDDREREIADLPVLVHEAGVPSEVAGFWVGWMELLRKTDPPLLAYLSYMVVRVAWMRVLLRRTGSLYLHCDPSAAHYLKVLLDGVFGHARFRNEVVWRRYGSHNDSGCFGRVHDTLLVYSRSDKSTWNGQWTPLDPVYVLTWSRWFGQLEGLVKVYSDCEITPSSSSAPALTGGCHGWHEAGSYPVIDDDDALWNCGNLAAGAQAWAAALAREISNGLWAPASPPSGFSATVSGRPQAGQVHIAGWDMVLGPLMR